MSEDSFKEYVGDEDIHDGVIAGLDHQNNNLVVTIRSGGWKRKQGELFKIVFCNVCQVKESDPVGRRLYALSELKSNDVARHFYFAAEDDEPCLEVSSETISVEDV